MYFILSIIFYIIAAAAGYAAGYQILLQIVPEFTFLHALGGAVVGLMFFPLMPLYPGIMGGEWSLALICYFSIALGVVFGNLGKKRTT
tara:strand:- start:204 stop:467 length:264 start_codon:yes stop_codon:yes gene_type:complete